MKNEFGIYETLRNISSTGNYKPQPILNKRDNNFARLLFAITRNKSFEKNNIGMVGISFIIYRCVNTLLSWIIIIIMNFQTAIGIEANFVNITQFLLVSNP